MGKKKKKAKGSKMKWFVGIMAIAIMACGVVLGMKMGTPKEVAVAQPEEVVEAKEEEKGASIFQGNDRPIAFMIDNNVNAQPQAGINQAYLVYEIIVEGKESRLMALFKGVDVSGGDVTVGPIRSARHYFMDYALENDAIYAHLGQSPQAEEFAKTYDVTDINGQIYDTGKARMDNSLFWRESSKKAPHNAYTSIKSIQEIAKQNGYRTTSKKDSLLKYAAEEINREPQDGMTMGISAAKTVTISYGANNTVQYVYDEQTKRYTRYSKGQKQVDELTGEDVTTKNLLVVHIENSTINDGENKDRQELNNVTEAPGYFITNGTASKIMAVKDAHGKPTKYVDLVDEEIEVNDGNTWINICPTGGEVNFE